MADAAQSNTLRRVMNAMEAGTASNRIAATQKPEMEREMEEF